jgi:uncharacterized protein YkwD
VTSLFTQYVGVKPPECPVRKLYPIEKNDESYLSRRLFELINQSRREAGLGTLAHHNGLMKTARLHSNDMRYRGYFGHRSPLFGDLDRRLSAQGVDYAYASENLALSTGASQAHEALMGSPIHRQNLLDPRLTHVGIGIRTCPDQELIYVTECFARIQP